MEGLNSTNKHKQTETSVSSDQFNSFLFWREPLPSIDDDLLELLVSSTNMEINVFKWQKTVSPTVEQWLLCRK